MSVTDTYEVEDIGAETVWVRCRRCGRMWAVFAETQRGWWRCPGEPHDGKVFSNEDPHAEEVRPQ